MPRKGKIDPEKLFNIMLENKNIIFSVENGKINKPSHICWSKMAQELDNVISSKYIYTIALEDRFGFMEKLNSDNIDVLYQNPTNTFIESSTSDSDTKIDESDNLLKFDITLTAKEWESIYCPNKIYKRSDRNYATRSYEVLIPNEWTNS